MADKWMTKEQASIIYRLALVELLKANGGRLVVEVDITSDQLYQVMIETSKPVDGKATFELSIMKGVH